MLKNLLKNDKMPIVTAMIICFLAVFGMISISGIRMFGVTLTAYRVLLPLGFLICGVSWLKLKSNYSDLERNREEKLVVGTMMLFIAWVCYGLLQAVLIDNINFRSAVQELFTIALAGMFLFIMCHMDMYGVKAEHYIKAMKCIYVIIMIGALVEIIIGVHLSSSKISEVIVDTEYDEKTIYIFEHMATTIFYNVNDYAAFTAIFLPLFFFSNSRQEFVLNLVVLGLGISILRINDAWICILTVALSFIMYLFLFREDSPKGNGLIHKVVSIVVVTCSYLWGHSFLRQLSLGNPIDESYSPISASNVLMEQLNNNSGSLFSRIDTYTTSVVNTITDTLGVGYGPANFTAYLAGEAENSNLLLDPHSLWVEIFAQYGIVIFALFVFFLIYLYIRLFKIYKKSKSQVVLAIILIDTAYAFAAFAPSSFLDYTYQWILIGVSLITVINSEGKTSNFNLPSERGYEII